MRRTAIAIALLLGAGLAVGWSLFHRHAAATHERAAGEPSPMPTAQADRRAIAGPSAPAGATAAATGASEAPAGDPSSALTPPPPFDAEAYARDPQAYCRAVVPARALQSAPATADSPRLRMLTPVGPCLRQGDSLPLKVRALPGAPVSFLAASGGVFAESGVGAVTVRADDDGVAVATFRADRGTIGLAPVLCASPLLAERKTWYIDVASADAAR